LFRLLKFDHGSRLVVTTTRPSPAYRKRLFVVLRISGVYKKPEVGPKANLKVFADKRMENFNSGRSTIERFIILMASKPL
jgi:hypothetical protein